MHSLRKSWDIFLFWKCDYFDFFSTFDLIYSILIPSQLLILYTPSRFLQLFFKYYYLVSDIIFFILDFRPVESWKEEWTVCTYCIIYPFHQLFFIIVFIFFFVFLSSFFEYYFHILLCLTFFLFLLLFSYSFLSYFFPFFIIISIFFIVLLSSLFYYYFLNQQSPSITLQNNYVK